MATRRLIARPVRQTAARKREIAEARSAWKYAVMNDETELGWDEWWDRWTDEPDES